MSNEKLYQITDSHYFYEIGANWKLPEGYNPNAQRIKISFKRYAERFPHKNYTIYTIFSKSGRFVHACHTDGTDAFDEVEFLSDGELKLMNCRLVPIQVCEYIKMFHRNIPQRIKELYIAEG